MRESHDRARHFLDFREALFAVVRGQSNHFNGFIAEKVTCCVDTIDTDVEKSAAAQIFSRADVAFFDLETEQRSEITKLAEVARVCDSYGVQVCVIEVEPISDHYLHVIWLGCAYQRF